MHFIVKKVGDQVSRAKHHTFFSPLILSVRCRDAERRRRIPADVAIWPYLAEKRKEGGEGQNSTSGFYQTETDVESAAAAAAAFKPTLVCYQS